MVVRAVRQCSAYHAQQQSVFIVYIFLDMKKLSRQSTVPCPSMTKEEFFARVDEAKKGSSKSFVNVDELDKYIRAL